MRILVINDDRSVASLLGRTLKHLGHWPVVASHPADALDVVRTGAVDAAIVALSLATGTGAELAEAIRAEGPALPVALSAGGGGSAALAAGERGEVLPKVWTVADVRRVVDGLEKRRRGDLPPSPSRDPVAAPSPPAARAAPSASRAASPAPPSGERLPRRVPRGSSPPEPQGTSARAPARAPMIGARAARPSPAAAVAAPGARGRKLPVPCRSWDDLRRLCSCRSGGVHYVTVKGMRALSVGEAVTVALALPDELVITLDAEVASSRGSASGPVFAVALTGLTPDVRERLLALIPAGVSEAPGADRAATLQD